VEYTADLPSGAKVLTAGVDTQDDRLEILVVGWGEGEESWVIHRESLFGDPSTPEVWKELDELLLRRWKRDDGLSTMIQCTLVDALGHRTAAVYSAVVARQARRVFASIGKDGGAAGQLVSPHKMLATSQGNVMRYVVDASQVKALIYSRLKILEPAGHGVIHFPMTVGESFFSELTAEHLITERNRFGIPSKKWALRPGHERNESLDCFGMALAAFRVICPTPARFLDLAAKLEAAPVDKPAPRVSRTKNWDGVV
jgi:phage terminase large subunit GpA-like protein